MKSNNICFSKLVLIIVIFCPVVLLAAPKPLVVEKNSPLRTKRIDFKINKPKAAKGVSLDSSLQIRGCWINDGFASISAKDKTKKKVKFSLSKDKSSLDFKKLKTVKYPVNVSINFKEERDVIARASSLIVNGKTKCESVKSKSGKKKPDCSASQAVSLHSDFSGIFCNAASNVLSGTSTAKLAFAEGDQFTIRKLTDPLKFTLLDGSFLTDLSDYTVIVNDQVITVPDILLLNGVLQVNAQLNDGKNKVRVHAFDSNGFQVTGNFDVWAGSNTLKVLLVNQSGGQAQSGKLTLTLADDPDFKIYTTYVNGQSEIGNLPGTTLSIVAEGDDQSAGFAAVAGNDLQVTLTLLPAIDINAVTTTSEFDGWIGSGVTLNSVIHTEDVPATLPSKIGKLAAGEEDKDIVIPTSGEGTRFMLRTFKTNPQSRLVRIRYRFQTSEYPGGYFGSKYNDFYNVSLRSSAGAHILDDGSSMNALGRAAFSPNGYTVWKSTVIPVNRQKKPSGDVVQAAVAVANVADGAYDSSVIVDKIEESSFAITQAEVDDIDKTPLKYLSLSAHPYFDHFTYINGTITLEGEENDKISNIYLQIMDEAKEVAKAQLSTQAASKLYKKKFGKTGKLEIKNPILLFKIFPNVLQQFNLTEDKTYSLVIQAESAKGAKAHKTLSTINALKRFEGTARYDGRDEDQGGDDWALPSVLNKVNDLSGITWGDFSNMNGGQFSPHELHKDGHSADGWIAGYNSLDQATADALINLLDTGLASKIRFMYVAYRRNEGNKFYRAISGRKLKNGRKLTDVILPDMQHTTHFHLEF